MESNIKNLAVFVSGTGTNFQAIQEAIEKDEINARIVLLISSKPGVKALDTAREHHIDSFVMDEKEFASSGEYVNALSRKLSDYKTDYILLAGYLKMIPVRIIGDYRGRIINIHPALLPKFGGKGMYGLNVHKAVLEAGEEYTGVTIHIVDEHYDHGPIIAQEKLKVRKGETPEELQKRVLKIEHQLYPRVVKELCRGKIRPPRNKAV